MSEFQPFQGLTIPGANSISVLIKTASELQHQSKPPLAGRESFCISTTPSAFGIILLFNFAYNVPFVSDNCLEVLNLISLITNNFEHFFSAY